MKLLIVGGTGNISWRLAEAGLREGWDITLLHRGTGSRRTLPPGCELMACDIRDKEATAAALGATSFDVVVDFLCYNRTQALDAVSSFGRRTAHYIFISTTALYDRAVARLPLTENSPIISGGWDYAVAKAEAEQVFAQARAHADFPVTVIRPAHTYDVILPESVGNSDWTNPWRVARGKPIVVHGDGTSLWTLTHSIDLANGIVAYVKTGARPGETYHITADETYTWRELTAALYAQIGASPPTICYRTTEEIDRVSPRLGNGLKGHKMWCDIYDNTKFKAACPSWKPVISVAAGLEMAVRHYQSDERLRVPNLQLDAVLDEICALR